MKIICMDDTQRETEALRKRAQDVVPDAQIRTCRTPDEAVQTAKAEGCDVLLTEIDLGRNGTGGILAAERIKQINPKVNIIFVTVCSEYEHAARLLPMRISGYITKPYQTETLSHELHHLLYAVS